MSSITNINNNSAVINVGRTTPVSPGITTSDRSIPVVVASDQPAIPVEEQNKIQSEVALSLLGIPRSEVALGIFADVNTYDVNPTEWSSFPETYTSASILGGNARSGWGTFHLPEEAGALVEAPKNKSAVLTSKRFFRYQPGRVSAATFGIKTTTSTVNFSKNPVIRKYGIYDNYDGYYWENKEDGQGDNFNVVRRTQSLFRSPTSPYGVDTEPLRAAPDISTPSDLPSTQLDDYRIIGKAPANPIVEDTTNIRERKKIISARFDLADATWTEAMTDGAFSTFYNGLSAEAQETFEEKCKRDFDYWIDMILMDLAMSEGGLADAHTVVNTRNYQTSLAVANRSAPYEITMYNAFKDVINGNDAASSTLITGGTNDITGAPLTYLQTLAQRIIDFFTRVNDSTTYPNVNLDIVGAGGAVDTTNIYILPTAWGDKERIETLLDTRKNYFSYFVSNFEYNPSNPYDTSTSLTYDEYISGESGLGEFGAGAAGIEVIKYKCQRDVLYILDGYKNDMSGGGNAETKFNSTMYYDGNGMSIYSQDDTGAPRERLRHTHLKDLIVNDLDNSALYYNEDLTSFSNTMFNGALATGNGLANIIIRNFSTEDITNTQYGTKAVAGNLITLRDGLVMVHAAVNDPSLLKKAEKKKARFQPDTNTFKLNNGIVTFGQHVRWVGSDPSTPGAHTLENGKVYKVKLVKGPKGNVFTLYDEVLAQDVTFTETGDTEFELVVPFIFPDVYDPSKYSTSATPAERGLTAGGTDFPGGDPYPQGMMFPYKYSSELTLPVAPGIHEVGFVDSALNTNVVADARKMREQMDSANFIPEYINWIKNNVDPEYYGVYEYRVPRTRFSTDKLNGLPNTDPADARTNKLVYSDIATGSTGKVRPGESVLDSAGVQIEDQSVYEYDFNRVTMLKIEFSWYGAVGALFLAYVPVSNGDARWVRVHHLRASNQLKISSLGNATLPITYTVYGGGDAKSLGYDDTTNKGYSQSTSHHLVKYGASYYIDGGDRGTVRLYSHTSPSVREVYGRKYVGFGGSGSNTVTYVDDTAYNLPYIARTPGSGEPENVFFMNGNLSTNNSADRTIKVVWTTPTRIYFSKTPQGTDLGIIVDRSSSMFGLETKREIISSQKQKVRNRVQVYPTKLSTANLTSTTLRLNMRKNPIYQTDFVPSAGVPIFKVSKNPDLSNYLLSPDNNPIPIDASYQEYMSDGDEAYGWFRGSVSANNISDEVTLFGKLYRLGNEYYFDIAETYAGDVRIKGFDTGSSAFGEFLRDERMTANGDSIASSTVSKTTEEKEGLSSILVTSDDQTPIPGTGSSVSTLYISPGADQFDLSDFYDYNKEYLSFPLTDQADALYFTLDSENSVDVEDTANTALTGTANVGCTWEEQ